MKKVGWRVAKFMARSCEKTEIKSLEEQLSCAIVALRAFERQDWRTLKKCGDKFGRLGGTWGEKRYVPETRL